MKGFKMGHKDLVTKEGRKRQAEKLKGNQNWKFRKKFSLQERFWNKVLKKSKKDCWIWNGYKDSSGYGLLTISKGRREGAHRASWIVHFGEIKNNLHVLHHCDNPSCVNPKHLFLGTNNDNIADRIKKGRTREGEKNANAKLTYESANIIRELYENRNLSQTSLAKEFCLCTATINHIIRNKIWVKVAPRIRSEEELAMDKL